MKSSMKKQIIEDIKKHYSIGKNDFITIVGSYAIGQETKDSDIDVHINTRNYKFYQKQSYAKGYRKKGEDAGYHTELDGKRLEIQITELPQKNTMFNLYVIYNEKFLYGNKKEFQKNNISAKKYFNDNYKELLREQHIHFFNTFGQLTGIILRKDENNIKMMKQLILRELYRLILLIDKKPYSSDKWLIYNYSKTRSYKIINPFVVKFIDSKTAELRAKKNIMAEKIQDILPKGIVVDKWWLHLNK